MVVMRCEPQSFFARQDVQFDVLGLPRAKTLVEKLQTMGADDVWVVQAVEDCAYGLELSVPVDNEGAIRDVKAALDQEKASLVDEMRGFKGVDGKPIALITASWFAEN